ncbi:MAG: hypothetical protein CMC52_02380 [Flavobacteriaceae bacterium]|nr:hypothetical protein [Flavobacteriaceae bacterium]|tara:strand:+ start:271 stop:990 length:720 start_codon:yes stop_codon:yes gene_type:complete
MKRINPDTGKVFIAGDPRPRGDVQDGKVFNQYNSSHHQKNGYFSETWIASSSKEKLKLARAEARQRQRLLKAKLERENPSILVYELNPETGKKYIKGDVVDGMYFMGYLNHVLEDGVTVPSRWATFKSMHSYHMSKAIYNIKTRTKKRGETLDPRVTKDYLDSIFPKDYMCPVLGYKMEWGEDDGKLNSPTVDRIDNSKGYVYGNLLWMSSRANMTKGNHKLEDIKKVIEFLEKNNYKG